MSVLAKLFISIRFKQYLLVILQDEDEKLLHEYTYITLKLVLIIMKVAIEISIYVEKYEPIESKIVWAGKKFIQCNTIPSNLWVKTHW